MESLYRKYSLRNQVDGYAGLVDVVKRRTGLSWGSQVVSWITLNYSILQHDSMLLRPTNNQTLDDELICYNSYIIRDYLRVFQRGNEFSLTNFN